MVFFDLLEQVDVLGDPQKTDYFRKKRIDLVERSTFLKRFSKIWVDCSTFFGDIHTEFTFVFYNRYIR